MSNPRKLAAIRRLEGNPGKRSIRDELAGLGTPVPPPRLTPAQLQRWHEIVGSLPDGHLTAADTSTLERMAVAWALFIETTAAINGEALVVERDREKTRNPLLLIRKQAAEEMNTCAMQLGLSPLARTRLVGQSEAEADVLSLLARPSRNN